MSGKKSFLFLLLLGCVIVSFAQPKVVAQDPVIFFELIENDSVALYFNREFVFTEKDCYDYSRKIRVTNNGDFNSYFEDRNFDQMLLGKGAYSNGFKHGYFEIYYPNGKIQSKGYYENNAPIGIWEYFYESGLPERTLDISDSVVLLLRHVDNEGVVRVENGQGKFDGVVAASLNVYGLHVRGNLVNGRPEGKWQALGPDMTPIYTEKFHRGKLIKSSLISKRKMKEAKVPPLLNTFFLGNYLYLLEGFDRQPCSESQQYFFNRYPSDSKLFTADFSQRINYLIETDIRANKGEHYVLGDNFMTIRFSVNEKGKATDIELVSEWGKQFFEMAKNAINKTVFSTNYKTMYFNFKLAYAGGLKYRYTFKFSKRDRNSKIKH